MTKVQELRLPTASASFSRWSVAYNVMFVLNLASTPFMAYLTEPHPGLIIPIPHHAATFDDYVNVTAAHFRQIFNNQTVHGYSRQEIATNSFRLHREMTIPCQVAQADAFDYILAMPASYYFGDGLRAYLVEFLTSNATVRKQMQPWQQCQHGYVFMIEQSEQCVWLEEVAVDRYIVWTATAVRETSETLLAKCFFRFLLTCYVLYALWCRYYRHYKILVVNLRHVGVSAKYTRYEIVVGDPAYAILSDPVVSLAMVIDMLWGVPYYAISLIYLTQFQDLWLYCNGCIYLARSVWYAYFWTRIFSFIIKWRQWEASFAPVDPSLLAMSTYIYSGPVVSLLCGTRL
ncbi:hypothetical protein AeNC1_008279, partial [Aphanomyces euteiches]